MRIDFTSPKHNDQKLVTNLVLLDATRRRTTLKEKHYKQQVAKYYSKRIRKLPLMKGDLVLRKNEVSRQESSRKLDQTWEGPYIIKANYINGSYKLQDMDGQEIARNWTINNLKGFTHKARFTLMHLIC